MHLQYILIEIPADKISSKFRPICHIRCTPQTSHMDIDRMCRMSNETQCPIRMHCIWLASDREIFSSVDGRHHCMLIRSFFTQLFTIRPKKTQFCGICIKKWNYNCHNSSTTGPARHNICGVITLWGSI